MNWYNALHIIRVMNHINRLLLFDRQAMMICFLWINFETNQVFNATSTELELSLLCCTMNVNSSAHSNILKPVGDCNKDENWIQCVFKWISTWIDSCTSDFTIVCMKDKVQMSVYVKVISFCNTPYWNCYRNPHLVSLNHSHQFQSKVFEWNIV